MAADGSKGVVDYVSNNEDAIGFVGSSWVTNEQDPEQKAYQNNIRLALLECKKIAIREVLQNHHRQL